MTEILERAPIEPIPRKVRPMELYEERQFINRPDFLYEPKIDGERCMARIDEGNVMLFSSKGNVFTERFPQVVRNLKTIPGQLFLDGEMAVVDERGIPRFELIKNYWPKT